MEKYVKQFVDEVKQVDEEERSIVHIISTEQPDRMGDIVRAGGMDDENYQKNPVVLFGHDYGSFPVGKSLWRKRTTRNGSKGILAKTQFADTDEGRKVFELWRDGFLNAASIGFMNKEAEPIRAEDGGWVGHDFKKWELLEYSIVPVPANAGAVRLSLDGLPEMLVKAFQPSIMEQRVKELEEENKRVSELSALVEELNAKILAYDDSIALKDAEIVELKQRIESLQNPPKKSVGISADELNKAIRGEISRMMGRVSI